MRLIQEIQKGESKTLEFKEKLPKNIAIAKTAIAFANGAGFCCIEKIQAISLIEKYRKSIGMAFLHCRKPLKAI